MWSVHTSGGIRPVSNGGSCRVVPGVNRPPVVLDRALWCVLVQCTISGPWEPFCGVRISGRLPDHMEVAGGCGERYGPSGEKARRGYQVGADAGDLYRRCESGAELLTMYSPGTSGTPMMSQEQAEELIGRLNREYPGIVGIIGDDYDCACQLAKEMLPLCDGVQRLAAPSLLPADVLVNASEGAVIVRFIIDSEDYRILMTQPDLLLYEVVSHKWFKSAEARYGSIAAGYTAVRLAQYIVKGAELLTSGTGAPQLLTDLVERNRHLLSVSMERPPVRSKYTITMTEPFVSDGMVIVGWFIGDSNELYGITLTEYDTLKSSIRSKLRESPLDPVERDMVGLDIEVAAVNALIAAAEYDPGNALLYRRAAEGSIRAYCDFYGVPYDRYL